MIRWLFVALVGCEDLVAEDPSLALGACDPQEMDMLAGRNGFMAAFSPCGPNQFGDATWSVTGHELYYQLGMTQHVLLADQPGKPKIIVPTPTSTGEATWIVVTDAEGKVTSRRVVHPIAPEVDKGPERLAIWDMDLPKTPEGQPAPARTVPLPPELSKPADLGRTRDPEHLLLTAERQGTRRLFDVSLVDGAATEPYPWLGPVDTFTYTPAADRAVSVKNGTATLWDTVAGRALGTWSPAVRGTVHPKGQWMMLEHLGEPVSVFGPDEPRAAELEAQLPADAEKKVRPEMLSFVNLANGERFVLDAIQGSRFEWYEITDYYGSFQLWGYDRKKARRNILLGDFLERMTGAEIGTLVGQTRKVGEKEGFLYGPPADAPAPAEAPPAAP